MASRGKSKSILAALTLMSCGTGTSGDQKFVLNNSNIQERASTFARAISENRLTFAEWTATNGVDSSKSEEPAAEKRVRILEASLGNCAPRDNRRDVDEEDALTRPVYEYHCDVFLNNLRFKSLAHTLGQAYIELRPLDSASHRPAESAGYHYEVAFENPVRDNVAMSFEIETDKDISSFLKRRVNTPVLDDEILMDHNVAVNLRRVSFVINR